jgi:hypothetical protein
MAGNGINEFSGMPANQYRQARARNFVDDHRDAWQPVPPDTSPDALALARTIACAVRDARPSVTLPPHIFIPWRAQNFFCEARFILNGSSTASVDLGAAEAASAEGIQRVSETVEFSTVPGTQPGTPGAGTILVPNGKVAVVRHWAAQPDDGGYFRDSSTGLPVVQFSLAIDGNRQIFSPALAGNHGTLADPFDVSYVIPEGQTIAVVAKSTDEDMWHLVETYFDGYFIEVQDINETLRAIDGRGTC